MYYFWGEKIKINLELGRKSYATSIIFFNISVVQVGELTLEAKFGSPTLKKGKAS
jgi:hypothetical protein